MRASIVVSLLLLACGGTAEPTADAATGPADAGGAADAGSEDDDGGTDGGEVPRSRRDGLRGVGNWIIPRMRARSSPAEGNRPQRPRSR